MRKSLVFARAVAQPSPESAVIKTIGLLVTSVIGALIGWLQGGSTGFMGSALSALLPIAGGVIGLIFSLLYRRYVGVLGAGGDRKGYPARKAYDRLRESLSGGNLPARLYADQLGAFLETVDRFFGDAGRADRTLFPHAFGLRTPAPLWTAAAFDSCLLLALIYPFATILIIWAASGDVGPAEAALLLKSNLPEWQRGLVVAIVAIMVFAILRSVRMKGWIAAIWFVSANPTEGLPTAKAIAIATIIISVLAGVVAANGYAIELAELAGVAIVGLIVLKAVRFVALGASDPSAYVGYLGYGEFLTLLFPATIMACLCAANLLSPLENWRAAGQILLLFLLLTLVNAPFIWASLGLTRALLRRGLELGGWSPYLLAIADAILASGIAVLSVFAMVIAVQIFDHLTEHGGGVRVLPLDPLITGIAEHPAAPEYWWVYALLLSTMIPSFINLMFGGASLARGVPGLSILLLGFMPAGRAVAPFERTWIALVLTVQAFLGAFFGIVAQVLLVVGVIFHIMPWFGIRLLDTARDVAALDLPMQVLGLFWGTS